MPDDVREYSIATFQSGFLAHCALGAIKKKYPYMILKIRSNDGSVFSLTHTADGMWVGREWQPYTQDGFTRYCDAVCESMKYMYGRVVRHFQQSINTFMAKERRKHAETL